MAAHTQSRKSAQRSKAHTFIKGSEPQHYDTPKLGYLDESTMGYYKRVQQQLAEDEFPSEDEKVIFVRNVMNETAGEEIKLGQNQTVSRILEQLLGIASPEQISRFLDGLLTDSTTACTDRILSHVTQTVLILSANLLRSAAVEIHIKEAISKNIGKLSEAMLVDIVGNTGHSYATHIVRTLLEVLTGVKVSHKLSSRSRSKRQEEKASHVPETNEKAEEEITSNFKGLFQQFCTQLPCKEVFENSLTSEITSPVLQTLLFVLHEYENAQCQDVCKKLLKHMKRCNGLPEYSCDRLASRVVECLLSVASEKQIVRIYDKHLEPRLVELALHPVGNFVIQSLIQHSSQEQAVMKAFHCYEPERRVHVAPLILTMSTYETYFKLEEGGENNTTENKKVDESTDVALERQTLHGSVLLQHLLSFENTASIVASLLNLKPRDLAAMACDQSGSHVIDALARSAAVGEKSRDGLITQMKGQFVHVTMDKYGSRTLESIWSTATLKQKTSIAAELSARVDQLSSDRFGRYAVRNCALQHFKQRRKDWDEVQTRTSKKRKMFNDIIGVTGHGKLNAKKSK
ncbi:PREDICTED: nucleolar protein 9-like isoform X4 [Priapulus caudatus]|uniref:Nucleolar protein 9-like isoform X4 n=1 Tax=Priapulus caudatus TaxID=37621 RepID=A0ABM1DPT4_PRICU|nr:PREDICTED: nucleolar protein 9-like isoform X4 [Priapulus caudatus]